MFSAKLKFGFGILIICHKSKCQIFERGIGVQKGLHAIKDPKAYSLLCVLKDTDIAACLHMYLSFYFFFFK